MDLDAFLWSLTREEIQFIATRDYGMGADRHSAALQHFILEQAGLVGQGQYWYPYEVVELCSHCLEAGHEREFAACTLLVIRNVVAGRDQGANLDFKLYNHAQDYDRLPTPLRDMVLQAYIEAKV